MDQTLSACRFRRGLLAVAVLLTALSLSFQLLHPGGGVLTRLVDLNEEMSWPTWYASLGLAASSILLVTIAWILRRANRRGFVSHWLFLGATFAALSAEEIVGLHEKVGAVLRRTFLFTGYLHFSWVTPAVVIVGFLGLAYLRFLASLPSRRRNQFVAAGAVYVLGALGLEMIGGRIVELCSMDSTAYVLCNHLEEFLELCGIALFNAALIEHLAELLGPEGLRLRFSRD